MRSRQEGKVADGLLMAEEELDLSVESRAAEQIDRRRPRTGGRHRLGETGKGVVVVGGGGRRGLQMAEGAQGAVVGGHGEHGRVRAERQGMHRHAQVHAEAGPGIAQREHGDAPRLPGEPGLRHGEMRLVRGEGEQRGRNGGREGMERWRGPGGDAGQVRHRQDLDADAVGTVPRPREQRAVRRERERCVDTAGQLLHHAGQDIEQGAGLPGGRGPDGVAGVQHAPVIQPHAAHVAVGGGVEDAPGSRLADDRHIAVAAEEVAAIRRESELMEALLQRHRGMLGKTVGHGRAGFHGPASRVQPAQDAALAQHGDPLAHRFPGETTRSVLGEPETSGLVPAAQPLEQPPLDAAASGREPREQLPGVAQVTPLARGERLGDRGEIGVVGGEVLGGAGRDGTGDRAGRVAFGEPARGLRPPPEHGGDDRARDQRRQQGGSEHGQLAVAPAPFDGALQRRHRPRPDRFAAQPAVQFVRELPGAGGTPDRLLFETAEAEGREVRGDGAARAVGARPLPCQRWRLLVLDAPEDLAVALAGERHPAGQRLVEHHAQRPHVARGADLADAAGGLLRRHVVRRAELGGRERERALDVDQLGEAEVGEVRLAVRVEEHVAGLEVAVQHAALVRVMDGAGDLREQPGRLPRRQRALQETLRERAAVHQLHGEELLPVGLADLMDGDDVRMVQPRDRLRLGAEARQLLRPGEGGRADELQGDGALEPEVLRLVDDPHAAVSDLPQQPVLSEHRRQRGPTERGEPGDVRAGRCDVLDARRGFDRVLEETRQARTVRFQRTITDGAKRAARGSTHVVVGIYRENSGRSGAVPGRGEQFYEVAELAIHLGLGADDGADLAPQQRRETLPQDVRRLFHGAGSHAVDRPDLRPGRLRRLRSGDPPAQFRLELRPVHPRDLGVEPGDRPVENFARPPAVEDAFRRFPRHRQRRIGHDGIEFRQRHEPRAAASLLGIGLLVPVGEPVLEDREQEAAETALPPLDAPEHLARDQVLEESLHVVGRRIVIGATLPDEDIERPPIGAGEAFQGHERGRGIRLAGSHDGRPHRGREQTSGLRRGFAVGWLHSDTVAAPGRGDEAEKEDRRRHASEDGCAESEASLGGISAMAPPKTRRPRRGRGRPGRRHGVIPPG